MTIPYLFFEGRTEEALNFYRQALGAEVQMPLGETFFARSFGMVKDRFGLAWMVIAGQKNP